MPKIVCTAHLSSLQPASDVSAHASALTVVWFQDEFAFPIAPNVLAEIASIYWESGATDFEH